MADAAALAAWAGALTLAVGAAFIAAAAVVVARQRRRRELAALPPRRRRLVSLSSDAVDVEIQEPGQPGDAQARCLRCPWDTSARTVLEAHAALTEHTRRAHGGIA